MSNLLFLSRQILSPQQARRRGVVLVVIAVLLGLGLAAWEIAWNVNPAIPLLNSPTYEDVQQGVVGMPRSRTGLILTNDNQGQVLFGRYCDSCHPAGREGIGASLRDEQFKRKFQTEAQIFEFVRTGGFDMRPYPPDFLPDEDLVEISRFILELPAENP
jgi:cytochrome c551/c552